ncbi:retrovirus-related pol polyprotein from transposon TNT 1-94 [Tanacetum coccineum]
MLSVTPKPASVEVSDESDDEPAKRQTGRRRMSKKKVSISVDDNIIPEPDVAWLRLQKRKQQDKDTSSVSKKILPDLSQKLKGIQTLTTEEQLAADMMQALKANKKFSKSQPHAGGSSEGTGTKLGVPDESTIILTTSHEGTGTKPGVPDEVQGSSAAKADVTLDWGSENESEYSFSYNFVHLHWKYTVAQHNGMIEVLGIRDMLYLHTKKNTGLAILNRIHGLKTRKECRQQHERSGGHVEDVRVIVLSKTRPVPLIRQVYEARHRCFGEKLSSRIHRKGSSDERSGGHVEDVRVIVLSKTRPVPLIRQVYEARHRCFGEKLSSRIHRKGSSGVLLI